MLNNNITKITPDELMNVFGFSPADNTGNLPTALPWKSKLIGQQIRSSPYKYYIQGCGDFNKLNS